MSAKWRGKAPSYCLRNMGLSTQREFRRAKRAELRAVEAAWAKFRRGAAFLPDDGSFDDVEKSMKRLAQQMSPKDWGA